MTKQEAIKKHRKMWMKLEKSGGHKPDLGIVADCWLCEYCFPECERCPLIWPKTGNESPYPCVNSYYRTWEGASTEERKALALKIATLEERM
jgi:hypothetical protein